jgi:RNA polymerase sigma-70 factor (ECF subfamily)
LKKERDIDAKLVKQFQNGRQEALSELVKRWHLKICKKAYWVVKDPDLAKDIAQECWKIIMLKIEALEEAHSFGSWVNRIVYSKSLDALRKNTRERLNIKDYYKDKVQSEAPPVNNDKLKSLVINSVKDLPIKQQIVIKLFYVEDYKLKEISTLLNISIGTAKSRLFHAREKLKLILKDRNYEN